MNFDPPLTLAAWNFGNLTMLGWLAAAALPWIIHRWVRRPQATTRWAAIDLLLSAIQNSKRRNQIQQLALLAIRTTVLVLVALAAAEPFTSRTTFGNASVEQTHRIIIIDQSTSMHCTQDDETRLEQAKALAVDIVKNSNTDDLFSVIGMSQPAENVCGRPSRDKSVVLAAIRGLSQSHTVANVSAALQAANAAIDSSEKKMPRHQIVFFTDLGRNSWSLDPSTRAQIEALAQRAKITIFNVDDQQRNNVAVVDLMIDPPTILLDQDYEIIAQVRSFGTENYSGLMLELVIDGQFRESQSVDLPANSSTNVRFTTRFSSEGTHTVQVSIASTNDSLTLDDHRWLTIKVLRQLKIACVEGTPNAASDLARALAPGQASFENFSCGITPHVIPASRLPLLDLAEFSVVFFCDIGELSLSETAHAARYVELGGNLAIYLGENSSPEKWNKLTRENGIPLFPVRFGAPVEAEEIHFDPLDYRHPIVAPFRGRAASGLAKVAISKYFQLAIRENHPTAEIVLAMNNGDPALVVDRVGLGRVAVMAIPCSLAAHTAAGIPWSTFAVNPSFLPVVRELVDDLVSPSQQQSNLLVGEPLVCRWDATNQSTMLRMRLPDGNQLQLPRPGSEDCGQFRFAETYASGIYRLTADGNEIKSWAVNLDPSESDLTTVSLETLPAALRPLSGERVATQQSSSRKQYSKSLLAVVFFLLLAESTVAWLLGRR